MLIGFNYKEVMGVWNSKNKYIISEFENENIEFKSLILIW